MAAAPSSDGRSSMPTATPGESRPASGPAAQPARISSGTPGGAPNPPAATSEAPLGRLTVIGTGHVFQVKHTIQLAIEALRPDIVFVELDRGRLHALQARAQGKPAPTGGTWVHRRLQAFQEDVAGAYGADVGEEMLAAVQGAQAIGARIALIDAPAEDTLRKALKQLTWREKLRAFGLLAKAGLESILPRRKPKASLETELRRYQDDPDKALAELQRMFPTLHRIVIADRDAIMARRIAHLLKGARHGVAVVGDGHVPGMLRLLDDLKPDVYRLADVREGRLPKPPMSWATGTTESVSFGFDAAGAFRPVDGEA